MENQSDNDELLRIVGEISISVWHLGYLTEQIGLDLGHHVGSHSAANARDAIRRHLVVDELPPWATECASAPKLIDWLDQVEECVGAYHAVVQAFAPARGSAPVRRLSDGSRHAVGTSDLKVLLGACRELSRTGDTLADALGFPRADGTVAHGYDSIVRTLYESPARASA